MNLSNSSSVLMTQIIQLALNKEPSDLFLFLKHVEHPSVENCNDVHHQLVFIKSLFDCPSEDLPSFLCERMDQFAEILSSDWLPSASTKNDSNFLEISASEDQGDFSKKFQPQELKRQREQEELEQKQRGSSVPVESRQKSSLQDQNTSKQQLQIKRQRPSSDLDAQLSTNLHNTTNSTLWLLCFWLARHLPSIPFAKSLQSLLSVQILQSSFGSNVLPACYGLLFNDWMDLCLPPWLITALRHNPSIPESIPLIARLAALIFHPLLQFLTESFQRSLSLFSSTDLSEAHRSLCHHQQTLVKIQQHLSETVSLVHTAEAAKRDTICSLQSVLTAMLNGLSQLPQNPPFHLPFPPLSLQQFLASPSFPVTVEGEQQLIRDYNKTQRRPRLDPTQSTAVDQTNQAAAVNIDSTNSPNSTSTDTQSQTPRASPLDVSDDLMFRYIQGDCFSQLWRAAIALSRAQSSQLLNLFPPLGLSCYSLEHLTPILSSAPVLMKHIHLYSLIQSDEEWWHEALLVCRGNPPTGRKNAFGLLVLKTGNAEQKDDGNAEQKDHLEDRQNDDRSFHQPVEASDGEGWWTIPIALYHFITPSDINQQSEEGWEGMKQELQQSQESISFCCEGLLLNCDVSLLVQLLQSSESSFLVISNEAEEDDDSEMSEGLVRLFGLQQWMTNQQRIQTSTEFPSNHSPAIETLYSFIRTKQYNSQQPQSIQRIPLTETSTAFHHQLTQRNPSTRNVPLNSTFLPSHTKPFSQKLLKQFSQLPSVENLNNNWISLTGTKQSGKTSSLLLLGSDWFQMQQESKETERERLMKEGLNQPTSVETVEMMEGGVTSIQLSLPLSITPSSSSLSSILLVSPSSHVIHHLPSFHSSTTTTTTTRHHHPSSSSTLLDRLSQINESLVILSKAFVDDEKKHWIPLMIPFFLSTKQLEELETFVQRDSPKFNALLTECFDVKKPREDHWAMKEQRMCQNALMLLLHDDDIKTDGSVEIRKSIRHQPNPTEFVESIEQDDRKHWPIFPCMFPVHSTTVESSSLPPVSTDATEIKSFEFHSLTTRQRFAFGNWFSNSLASLLHQLMTALQRERRFLLFLLRQWEIRLCLLTQSNESSVQSIPLRKSSVSDFVFSQHIHHPLIESCQLVLGDELNDWHWSTSLYSNWPGNHQTGWITAATLQEEEDISRTLQSPVSLQTPFQSLQLMLNKSYSDVQTFKLLANCHVRFVQQIRDIFHQRWQRGNAESSESSENAVELSNTFSSDSREMVTTQFSHKPTVTCCNQPLDISTPFATLPSRLHCWILDDLLTKPTERQLSQTISLLLKGAEACRAMLSHDSICSSIRLFTHLGAQIPQRFSTRNHHGEDGDATSTIQIIVVLPTANLNTNLQSNSHPLASLLPLYTNGDSQSISRSIATVKDGALIFLIPATLSEFQPFCELIKKAASVNVRLETTRQSDTEKTTFESQSGRNSRLFSPNPMSASSSNSLLPLSLSTFFLRPFLPLICPRHMTLKGVLLFTQKNELNLSLKRFSLEEGKPTCRSICLSAFDSCNVPFHRCLRRCNEHSAENPREDPSDSTENPREDPSDSTENPREDPSDSTENHSHCPFPCTYIHPICGHSCTKSCGDPCGSCHVRVIRPVSDGNPHCKGSILVSGFTKGNVTFKQFPHYESVLCGETTASEGEEIQRSKDRREFSESNCQSETFCICEKCFAPFQTLCYSSSTTRTNHCQDCLSSSKTHLNQTELNLLRLTKLGLEAEQFGPVNMVPNYAKEVQRVHQAEAERTNVMEKHQQEIQKRSDLVKKQLSDALQQQWIENTNMEQKTEAWKEQLLTETSLLQARFNRSLSERDSLYTSGSVRHPSFPELSQPK